MMNEIEVKEKFKEFLCSDLGIDESVLEYDTELFGEGDVNLDSIDSLEIIAFADNEWGVSMTGVGKEHFRNIDTLAAYVCAHKE